LQASKQQQTVYRLNGNALLKLVVGLEDALGKEQQIAQTFFVEQEQIAIILKETLVGILQHKA
jgi:hypothetical protein